MPSQKGRDFLLKIGDGASPTESFATIGAARTNALSINNNPVDATSMADGGVASMLADGGTQTMQISIDGLFKDSPAEETLRSTAFARVQKNFQLAFPNGDLYQAAFVIAEYSRSGAHDGLESFSATLIRSGSGTFTPGA